MPTEACETIRDQLVDYADGVIDKHAGIRVAAHLTTCPSCRRRAVALSKALVLAQESWSLAVKELDHVQVPSVPRAVRRHRLKRPAVAASAAAVILLLTWTAWQQPRPDDAFLANRDPTIGDLEHEIWQAGAAAELLAAASLVGETPGGELYARTQLRAIALRYSSSSAAAAATERLRIDRQGDEK